jgi:hypothetical protein
VITPDNWPAATGLLPGGHDLDGVTNLDFRRFDLDYPDSDAPRTYFEKTKDSRYLWGRTKFGKYDSPSRFSEWNREFQQMLQKDPTGDSVPNLMTVRLGVDHTSGMNADKHTPRSMVADNDYAVGQLVEAVSKSPIWKSTAIFIIEDDAQNGPDHVDAHRSTCYVISPWIRQGSVDHNFHNTASCLRTIELLLGLPPMSQFDAAAAPMYAAFGTTADLTPYKALPPSIDINAKNTKLAYGAAESARMDFAEEDRAPMHRLNEIIWKSIKGSESEAPAPVHRYRALVQVP